MNIIIMELYSFYKIECKDETVTETYIGSTIDFKNRKKCHKTDCCNINSERYNLKVYKYIRANGGWQNFNMIEIQICEYESKIEAHIRENELMEEYNSHLNMIKAYISPEQKKEYFKKYGKIYREDNKETIQKYRKDNKEKIQK
jgi:hypothetical protein